VAGEEKESWEKGRGITNTSFEPPRGKKKGKKESSRGEKENVTIPWDCHFKPLTRKKKRGKNAGERRGGERLEKSVPFNCKERKKRGREKGKESPLKGGEKRKSDD